MKKFSNINYQFSIWKGFTLIELVVTMGIFVALLSIATINLSGTQARTSLQSATEVFLADLKSQQLRSMVGEDGGGGSASSYGVHFESTSYTLFNGASYSGADPSNFTVNLPANTQFVPVNSDIVFGIGSGEISGDTVITIRRASDGVQREINLNKYGVVEAVN
jgi:prepilin-type N-terminal cleavage/methylation domain-containing protein